MNTLKTNKNVVIVSLIAVVGANAIIKKDINVPATEIMRSGLLPNLSDSLPITRVDKNWANEKQANNSPLPKSESPNFCVYE